MPPTPPPPEPVEPPIPENMLPAGGPPYDGLFREPSLLVLAGHMNADRYRQDLPNPLISTAPLFPELANLQNDSPVWQDSPLSSRRSSRSDRRSIDSASRPPSPRPAPAERAFDDPSFRTLPPPPGMNLRPFPLPTVHLTARGTDDNIVEYDPDCTYGGPQLNFVTSLDMMPWRVSQDWKNRDASIRGNPYRYADLFMEGRGARRHVRVWQKKAEGGQAQAEDDDR